eukprot:1824861-Prymnesium_polylepis.1
MPAVPLAVPGVDGTCGESALRLAGDVRSAAPAWRGDAQPLSSGGAAEQSAAALDSALASAALGSPVRRGLSTHSAPSP